MEDSRIPLSFEEQQKGEELYKNGSVKEVIFSGSSYQIEVSDRELDQDFWVMLQLGAQNEISDHFCTCSKGEEGISCAHLAAAQKRIFLGKEVPLHQRYVDSFWRYLLQIAAKHQSLKPQEGQYFEFRPKTEKGKAKKIEFFETKQDDSFKLSTLSTEELSLYRSGKAHFTTRFEISFWSDIAKWLLNLYETTKEVKIRFEGFDPYLPKKIVIDCIDAELVCALDKKDWPLVIPSLASVDSPIPVYELGDVKIKKITYKNQQFIIDSEPISFKEGHPTVDLDEWIYVHEEGFFAKKSHPLLAERVIEQDKIPYFLEKFPHIISRFLEKYTYDPNPTPAKYQLLFSKEGNLVIAAYLFSPKDITQYFAPWAFIENKGFFRVAKMTFSRLITTISREQVAD
ncbi:MAG: hypothetical protein FJZ56_05060, partial [Chlamydiae bacterium]|nr:hypothetical protein [Chlamydiota bacterium]